jgi:hypothetical protein
MEIRFLDVDKVVHEMGRVGNIGAYFVFLD